MLKTFISYSHKDTAILDRLHTHLSVLLREGKISGWYDRKILAGGEIEIEISIQLQHCNLFLAIVSPDFLASNYCYEKEMQTAIELHNKGQLSIVPIIAEPCDWKNTPLNRFKAIPKDGIPIAEWPNANKAYLDIVAELRLIVDEKKSNQSEIPGLGSPQPINNSSRYKVKREFDYIDKSDFLAKSYQTIRDQIKHSINEIGDTNELKGRFSDINDFGFTCTLINKVRSNSVGHITVHARPNSILGDITYSYVENASSNSANGTFLIETSDYELFFRNGFSMGGSNSRVPLNAIEVALWLWKQLLDRAGVEFA